MQSEDDLRGLAKVMDFMRAISIMLVLVHIYWYCHAYFVSMNYTVSVVDKILINFQDNTGLFNHIIITKFFSVLFLALSCLGTKGVKIKRLHGVRLLFFGFRILFFLSTGGYLI